MFVDRSFPGTDRSRSLDRAISMRRILIAAISVALALLVIPPLVFSRDNSHSVQAPHVLDAAVMIGIVLILLIAKIGGVIFERINQPPVLGELIGGIIAGNLSLIGLTGISSLKSNEVLGALAEIGVILLLFEVGLESNISEMIEVGWSSLAVAVAGVVAPFFLGWAVAAYFIPQASQLEHIFIGAILCATSVGITARVLKDTNQLGTREARIILGAAVIDDVLGLLILAVITGAINAAQTGTSLALMGIVAIAAKSVLFLAGAILAGHFLVPRLFHHAGKLESNGALLALSLSFCFLLAWAASKVGLAPIIGAFAAGLVLDEAHFESFRSHEEMRLEQLIAPVNTLLVPIFFVMMGLRVELGSLARPELLAFACALTLAALVGKQVCALAVVERNINRVAVGIGMIPRGEVGIIMAGIGAGLVLPNAQGANLPVVDTGTFGAVVIMVIATTLVTPPLLTWALSRSRVSTGESITLSLEPQDKGAAAAPGIEHHPG
jgi:Kef-type K+ transport system membrane component KefB